MFPAAAFGFARMRFFAHFDNISDRFFVI